MKKLITFCFTLAFVFNMTVCFAQWPGSTAVNVPVSTATGDQYQGFWTKSSTTTDGSGGAITCWYNQTSPYEIYAARLNKNGAVQWSVTVCASAPSNSRANPTIISDGAGGAIVVWEDGRDASSRDLYAARLSPTGSFIWGSGNGLALATGGNDGNKYYPVLVSDGAGGAIIAWTANISDGGDVYAKHVSAGGTLSWGGVGGLKISNASLAQTWPVIAGDGNGGAIIAWEDYRNGTTNHDIYAKRVDASGATVWGGLLGIAVCDTINNQSLPVILSDGSNGAIIAWLDGRNGGARIFAQKVNGTGVTQWTKNGIVITTASSENIGLATNGAGGAYIVWNTGNNQPSSTSGIQNIFAQLVTSAGAIQWLANGKAICSQTGTQWRPDIISTPDGGAIIAWGDYRGSSGTSDIYAQKVDALGAFQWLPATGDTVTTAACSQGAGHVAVASDGCNGAVLTWMDRRNDGTSCLISDIYAQNINSDGTLGGTSGTVGCSVIPPPHAVFQSSDSTICATKCIDFTDMSTGSPTSWKWTFQGGTPASSTARNPQQICYATGGNSYNVKLVATNSGGPDSVTYSSFITVYAAPPAPTIYQNHDTLHFTPNLVYAYQWYDSTYLIPNATDSMYIATHSGNYSVRVTNENGCVQVGSIIIFLGLSDFAYDNSISIFPNPAKDELIITSNSKAGDVIISVYNSIGEMMFEERTKLVNHIPLDIKNLSGGIYFVRVMNENDHSSHWIGRFVKE